MKFSAVDVMLPLASIPRSPSAPWTPATSTVALLVAASDSAVRPLAFSSAAIEPTWSFSPLFAAVGKPRPYRRMFAASAPSPPVIV